jgi:hypothetical protein
MRTSALLAAIGAICVPMLSADLAQAQATRTWVSGVGDDANPCSRTAPCKTFAGAISKTASGGIINCLDPGGFGALTITKSITVDCVGTLAGVLASGVNGINVNAAGIVVHLRNLQIEGNGTGVIGVNILAAATVHIENCFIYGFRSSTAAGIRVATTAATELSVSNTTIADNGIGTTTGGGILVNPTTANGAANVNLNRVLVRNNSVGVTADGSGSSSANGIRVFMTESEVSQNAGHGVRGVSTGASTLVMTHNSNITNNVGTGLIMENSASAVVGSTVIQRNGAGVSGTVQTFQNNQLNNNSGNNGTFTAPGLTLQ